MAQTAIPLDEHALALCKGRKLHRAVPAVENHRRAVSLPEAAKAFLARDHAKGMQHGAVLAARFGLEADLDDIEGGDDEAGEDAGEGAAEGVLGGGEGAGGGNADITRGHGNAA